MAIITDNLEVLFDIYKLQLRPLDLLRLNRPFADDDWETFSNDQGVKMVVTKDDVQLFFNNTMVDKLTGAYYNEFMFNVEYQLNIRL